MFGSLPQLLAKGGWEVHLVSSPGADSKRFEGTGVTNHALPMERDPSVLKDLLAFIRWVRLMRSIRPDVLFVATPKASLLGLVAAWITAVPTRIYGLWGLRLETTAGVRRTILGRFEKLASDAATAVLAVSQSLSEKYLKLGLCGVDKIFVLGSGSSHGVDTNRFIPETSDKADRLSQEIGLQVGLPVIGFVGRFCRDKGAETLLETRRQLRNFGLNHELLLVGAIEGSLDVLHELGRTGLPVKHVGDVENVENYYPLMDLLVLPTMREGFPNVILEAAACGVPAVTTDATGAVDSVVHGVTGLTVDANSPEAFGAAVRDLMTQADTRRRLGASARQRAVAEFSESLVLNRVMKFLEQFPERPAPPNR
jgi:glycosyltransferase involved in cell wall biosynthesis